MKQILFLSLLLSTMGLFAQNNEHSTSSFLKKKILIESQFLIATPQGNFFPLYNSDFSINYGINKFCTLGLFHDRSITFTETENKKRFYADMIGLRANVSILPLLDTQLTNKLCSKFDFYISASAAYDTNGSAHTFYFEIKDHMKWAHYYRAGIRYFKGKYFYWCASVGLYNSESFFLGCGIKL